MPSSQKPSKPEHYRHGGADRANLPTEQTSRFMEEDHQTPIAYPPPPPPKFAFLYCPGTAMNPK